MCPLWLMKLVADKILDMVFGPADDFDYVSTTAPSSPPPTY